MEFLPNGLTLDIPGGCFPLSTDTMALGFFAVPERGAKVLDLGSGCGSLGLLLCASRPDISVTGLELDEKAHLAALENISRNALCARMESLCADLRSVSARFSPGQFSCCVSNPPYFSGGPASRSQALARRNDTCSIAELMAAAAWAVKFGGDFFLVQRPENLGALISQGALAGFEAKKLCLLRHRPSAPVKLILLQLRKGAKPGLRLVEWSLWDAAGNPTDVYRKIYHIREA